VRVTAVNETPEQSGQATLSLKTAFIIVVVLTFVCFIPDLNNSLLSWDDSGYITNNVRIRTLSVDTVRWAFTELYCNYWAPLTWLSLAVDYAFTGLNPVGYHLTNNVLHSCNAGLFFLIAHQLLTVLKWGARPAGEVSLSSARSEDVPAIHCALLAALLFAIHPLRVESVVWASERKDVLGMFFGLPALLAYLYHVRTSRENLPSDGGMFSFVSSPYYWIMMVFYTLSLLSKAMFVTLPVLLLVMDWFPLKRLHKSRLLPVMLEKLPLLILAGSTSLITIQTTAITKSAEYVCVVTFWPRVLLAFKSLLVYIWMFIYPVTISPVYFHPGNNVSIDVVFVLSVLLFIAISGICILKVRRQPLFLAAWLLFLMPFIPMSGLVQSGCEAMAARFTYIPALSVSLMAALGIFTALDKVATSRRKVLFIKISAVVLLVFYACVTVRDTGFWKNDTAFWSRVIELQPHRFGKPYFERSMSLNIEGEYQKSLSDVNEALAIATLKGFAGVHEIYAQRAMVLRNMKKYEGAVADLSRAIESSGGFYRNMYYKERGELYKQLGKIEQANADFKAANPGNGMN
jgi:hypothetical protein